VHRGRGSTWNGALPRPRRPSPRRSTWNGRRTSVGTAPPTREPTAPHGPAPRVGGAPPERTRFPTGRIGGCAPRPRWMAATGPAPLEARRSVRASDRTGLRSRLDAVATQRERGGALPTDGSPRGCPRAGRPPRRDPPVLLHLPASRVRWGGTRRPLAAAARRRRSGTRDHVHRRPPGRSHRAPGRGSESPTRPPRQEATTVVRDARRAEGAVAGRSASGPVGGRPRTPGPCADATPREGTRRTARRTGGDGLPRKRSGRRPSLAGSGGRRERCGSRRELPRSDHPGLAGSRGSHPRPDRTIASGDRAPPARVHARCPASPMHRAPAPSLPARSDLAPRYRDVAH
jgi:hypothetical protein